MRQTALQNASPIPCLQNVKTKLNYFSYHEL